MSKKIRADIALENLGLAESRTKAQAMIMAGEVWLGDQRIDKPATPVSIEQLDRLEVKLDRLGYVGRGAEKILPVLQAAGWDLKGKTCVDVGASTGGFTEVLLEAGAREIWAIDVGYGQLHPRLRDNPAVVVRERTNFRHWDPQAEPARFQYAVMDVSFISTTLLIPVLGQVMAPGGEALILVKPQFELPREQVPRSGVVRDPALVEQAINRVAGCATESGFEVLDRFPAGVEGRKGNREQFLRLGVAGH